jgi:hypothetical protein
LVWFIDWIAKWMTGRTPVPPSQMMYYPDGVNPFGGYDGLLIGFLGAPISLVVGSPLVAYNLILLAAFPASALATYALCRRLTGSLYASAVAGFMFGFSPYMMVRATQHLNLTLTFVLPLLALALVNFLDVPKRKTAAWLAAAVLLTGLCSLYYMLFGMGLIALGVIINRRDLWKRKGASMFAALLIAAAALAPSLPLLVNKPQEDRLATYDFVSRFGAEPLNFIVPHPLTNIFGAATKFIYADFHGGSFDFTNVTESTSYFGLITLGLAAYAFASRKKRQMPHTALWFSATAVFTTLSLGMEIRVGEAHFAMPYAAVWNVFPFSMIRAPDRFFIVAYLAATVLASFALDGLRDKIRAPFARRVFFGMLVVGLVAERLIIPYPLFRPAVSDFYRELGKDAGAFAIVEFPISYPGRSEYNFLQTYHNKPIVDGEFFYSAYTKDTFMFIRGNPLLASSVCYDRINVPPVLPDLDVSLERLRRAGVRYIIVHNVMLANEPVCGWLKDYLHRTFAGFKPYFSDGDITVYRI